MGERKVLNKYIPADFDPKLVPRGKKPKDELIPVRMMLPFTVQCSTCSAFMYRGRKFNSKKEPVKGSEGKYLGIQRWRFIIKCTACARPITFLTDPKNGDYEMETGGTRTYEVHKDKKRVMEEAEADDAETEKLDPMKALENRVLASQKEMADLDNLDEIKAMNMRHLKMMASMKNQSGGKMDVTDVVLQKTREKEEADKEKQLELDDNDEALIKSIKFGKQPVENGTKSAEIVRLDDKAEKEMHLKRRKEQELMEKQQKEMQLKAQKNNSVKGKLNTIIKVKRKRKTQAGGSNKKEKINSTIISKIQESSEKGAGSSALGMLGGYGSDSDSD